jgi:predicted MFS family arabinose efflux permease
MLVCDAIPLVTLISVPVAQWWGWLTTTQLLVVAVVNGTCQVMFSTAYQVYVPSLISPERLAEGNAALQGSARAAEIGGRGLAGLLAAVFGPAAALLVDAASFAVSAVCLRGIRTHEVRPRAAGSRRCVRAELGEGLRFVFTDRYLRVIAVFIAVANTSLVGLLTLEVVFLARDLHVVPALLGGLLAASGVGGVLGAVTVTRITSRWGTARGLLLSTAMTFPLGLAIPLTQPGPGLGLLVLGYLGVGAGVTIASITLAGFWQTYCPRHLLGRVVASLTFLVKGATPLGAVLVGVLGNSLGNRTTLWITTTLLVLAVVMLIASPIRGIRNLPDTPTDPGGKRL